MPRWQTSWIFFFTHLDHESIKKPYTYELFQVLYTTYETVYACSLPYLKKGPRACSHFLGKGGIISLVRRLSRESPEKWLFLVKQTMTCRFARIWGILILLQFSRDRRVQGSVSWNLSVTDNCYKLLKSLHLIGWERICQWKTLTKHFMKCPPGDGKRA